MAQALRVLLVEDSKVLTERLTEAIRQIPDVELIGTADTEAAALAALRERGCAFACDLAGDGELRADLTALAARLGLERHVRFLGNVPHAQLTAALSRGDYDLAVLASLETPGEREGIPVALMEAMAAALPVVATRTGSLEELVVPGTGTLVPQRDAGALDLALQGFLADPGERRRAGKRGRAFVRAEFAVEETTRRFLELAYGTKPGTAAIPEYAG